MISLYEELESLIENSDFDLYVTKAKDGVEELRIKTHHEKLQLDFLQGNFRDRIAKFRITAGHGSLQLAKEISELTGIKLLNPGLSHYANQQSIVNLRKSVRGKRVIVIGSICRSICDDATQEKKYFSGADNYDQLMDILQTISTCWARYIILASPYFDFNKQDVMKGRQHLPFAKFAQNIESFRKLRGLISMFPHCEQTKNAYRDISVDYIPIQLFAYKIMMLIMERYMIPRDKICIGAFDAGSVKRLASLSEKSQIDLFINYKKKNTPQDIQSMGSEGNPVGYVVFPIDDFQHSGGTTVTGIHTAKKAGATSFFPFIGHIDSVVNSDTGIHADDLILGLPEIEKFIFSDSTPLAWELRKKAVEQGLQNKIMVLKASEILAHDLMRCVLELPASEFLE